MLILFLYLTAVFFVAVVPAVILVIAFEGQGDARARGHTAELNFGVTRGGGWERERERGVTVQSTLSIHSVKLFSFRYLTGAAGSFTCRCMRYSNAYISIYFISINNDESL